MPVCDSATAVILGHFSFTREGQPKIWPIIVFKLPPLHEPCDTACSNDRWNFSLQRRGGHMQIYEFCLERQFESLGWYSHLLEVSPPFSKLFPVSYFTFLFYKYEGITGRWYRRRERDAGKGTKIENRKYLTLLSQELSKSPQTYSRSKPDQEDPETYPH